MCIRDRCNGDSITDGTGTTQGITTDFSELYAIVGGNVPDLRGEFIRALDDGRSIDPSRGIRTAQSELTKTHGHSATSTTTTNVSDPGHLHQAGYFSGSFGGSSGATVFRSDNNSNHTAPGDFIKNNTTGVSVSATTTTTVTDLSLIHI